MKKRVALRGKGKRGGARTIVAPKLAERWFFLYGFSKNERSNIVKDELRALQEVAKDLLGFAEDQGPPGERACQPGRIRCRAEHERFNCAEVGGR